MEFDIISFILIFIRLTTFIALSKVIFPSGSSNWLKVGFSIVLTYIMLPVIPQYILLDNFNFFIFILAVINEALTGTILSLITNILFDILTMVGAWFDTHIGMTMGSIYDPNTNSQLTVSSKLLHYTGLAIFFMVNGHHILIKSFLHSFLTVPIGQSSIVGDTLVKAIEVIINYFVIGIKISLPIVLIILLTEIAMSLISRIIPQINVMVIGMPIKLIVGLLTLLIALPIIMKLFMNVVDRLPQIFETIFTSGTVNYAFAFTSGEKTEDPTPKRKSDKRKEGHVPKSKEVSSTFSMIGIVLVILLASSFLVKSFSQNIIYYLGNISTIEISDVTIKSIALKSVIDILSNGLLFILPILIFGIIGNLVQTGFLYTKNAIKPNFGKLNPINGFKQLFSKKSIIELLKNIITIIVLVYSGGNYILGKAPKILQISNLTIESYGVEIKSLIIGILTKVTIILIVLAVVDYIIQYRFYMSSIKMTKQEVKEEYKALEGDPVIKGKIKQKQREMSQRRMMAAVPSATVIITNPTHFAVAIKYDEDSLLAPKVVAKGVDAVAFKIREIANEHSVPIIENRPLARLLYAEVEIDQEIPEEMYQAVAEILAMIYNMKKKI